MPISSKKPSKAEKRALAIAAAAEHAAKQAAIDALSVQHADALAAQSVESVIESTVSDNVSGDATTAPSETPKSVAKPILPENTARLAAIASRQAIIDGARAFVASYYNGPSLTVHKRKPGKLADYISRVTSPVQRTDSPTQRDNSQLALCLSHADASFSFNPVAFAADLGAQSRLASLGYIAYTNDAFRLTESGVSHARGVIAQAAKHA